MKIQNCSLNLPFVFGLLTMFKLSNTAPIFVPSPWDWSTAYGWPSWTGVSPYLYHPSIRWIHQPPLFYIWPIAVPQSPSSTSSPSNTDRVEDRLFPSYSKQNSSISRNVFFEIVNQSNLAEHRHLPETVNEMEINDVKAEHNNSDSVNVTSEREKRQVVLPKADGQSKSLNGKFLFDGLSMLGSALAATAFNRPIPNPHEFLPYPYPPPYFQPFIFPGPSALYPQMFPLGHVNSQSYYPTVPSPYQALSVDSLLIPLVGMVGLSLLVPDIAKTKRKGRPSDFDGLDAFKRISDDRECLKQLACEFGVVFNPNDDPAAIKRVLERALAAKHSVPLHHYEDREQHQNCGSYNCVLDLSSPQTISALLGRQSAQHQSNSSMHSLTNVTETIA